MTVVDEDTIMPTHRCFDDALDYLEAVAARGGLQELEQHHLVHAIVTNTADGRRFAHAWVERGGVVIETGMLRGTKVVYTVKKEEHARWLIAERVTRYTPREAYQMNLRHGTYGPWEADYKALCREARKGAA